MPSNENTYEDKQNSKRQKLLRKQSQGSDKSSSLQVDGWGPILNDEGLSYCKSVGVGASHDDAGAFLQHRTSDGLVVSFLKVVPWSTRLKVARETPA